MKTHGNLETANLNELFNIFKDSQIIDIINVCKSNKILNNRICKNDYFWQLIFKHKYGDSFLEFKPQKATNLEWYKILYAYNAVGNFTNSDKIMLVIEDDAYNVAQYMLTNNLINVYDNDCIILNYFPKRKNAVHQLLITYAFDHLSNKTYNDFMDYFLMGRALFDATISKMINYERKKLQDEQQYEYAIELAKFIINISDSFNLYYPRLSLKFLEGAIIFNSSYVLKFLIKNDVYLSKTYMDLDPHNKTYFKSLLVKSANQDLTIFTDLIESGFDIHIENDSILNYAQEKNTVNLLNYFEEYNIY